MTEPAEMKAAVDSPTDDAGPARGERSRPAVASPRAIALFLGIVGLVTTADLTLKSWAFKNAAGQPVQLTQMVVEDEAGFWRQYPHEPTVLVPGVLNLRLTTNTGAVFGTAKGAKWLFVGVSVVAIVVLIGLFIRSDSRASAMHVALSLILAGALGNLYDRLVYSAVRDMLHLFPTTGLWPWIFNLADASLMVGVGLMLMLTLFRDREPRSDAAGASP